MGNILMNTHKESLKIYDRLNKMMRTLKVSVDHPSWDYGARVKFNEICIRLAIADQVPTAWTDKSIVIITDEMVTWAEERMPAVKTRGMKLWLITATALGYDCYDSAVVAAKTSIDAATIHPSGGEYSTDTWVKPSDVKAVLIGTAKPGTKAGTVICASFNAG